MPLGPKASPPVGQGAGQGLRGTPRRGSGPLWPRKLPHHGPGDRQAERESGTCRDQDGFEGDKTHRQNGDDADTGQRRADQGKEQQEQS